MWTAGFSSLCHKSVNISFKKLWSSGLISYTAAESDEEELIITDASVGVLSSASRRHGDKSGSLEVYEAAGSTWTRH